VPRGKSSTCSVPHKAPTWYANSVLAHPILGGGNINHIPLGITCQLQDTYQTP
jgi:hypothetical protein